MCDFDTNENGHRMDCDCPVCMPPGADGALEDALDAAGREMASASYRGAFVVRPLAKTVHVSWRGDGSRTDVNRRALHAAARHVEARGLRASVAHLDLYVAA